jgi:uncharacterized membrane protein YdjX (TVP38/TMEM64 family)
MIWSKLQRIIFILFLVLTIGLFIVFQIFGHNIDSENIKEYLNNFGIWAPLIFILLYTLGTIFIPATPFMITAGILFGFKYGLLYSIIGGLLSSTFVFTISRKSGKEWVEKILEHRYLKHLNEYNKRLETGAIWDIMFLRVTPIMPFNALNILMGVSRITTKDYIMGTFLGLIPSNALTVYIGAFITKIF